jgi:hypothetical protein
MQVDTMAEINTVLQGSDVGRVISSWKHDGRMELLLDIDENRLQGAFVRQFVEKGMCKVSTPPALISHCVFGMSQP